MATKKAVARGYVPAMSREARVKRGRPVINLSLSAEGLELLDRLVGERGTDRTEVVLAALEALLLVGILDPQGSPDG